MNIKQLKKYAWFQMLPTTIILFVASIGLTMFSSQFWDGSKYVGNPNWLPSAVYIVFLAWSMSMIINILLYSYGIKVSVKLRR